MLRPCRAVRRIPSASASVASRNYRAGCERPQPGVRGRVPPRYSASFPDSRWPLRAGIRRWHDELGAIPATDPSGRVLLTTDDVGERAHSARLRLGDPIPPTYLTPSYTTPGTQLSTPVTADGRRRQD